MKQTHIAVSKLRPFEKNPYQIRDDAEMDALVESVRENGVLTPLIVRPIENTDEYEVISGHRRLPGKQGLRKSRYLSVRWIVTAPPLPWWTVTCTVSIFCPLKRRLPIS